jgi:DNA-binding CsgD family transcriptional regulator
MRMNAPTCPAAIDLRTAAIMRLSADGLGDDAIARKLAISRHRVQAVVTSAIERVRRQLSATHVSLASIARNAGLTTPEVLDALKVIERQSGAGQFIDVSARDNVSVALIPHLEAAE